MTNATLSAVSITVNTTGCYDKFLTKLEANIGKAQPGDVKFVLHADEDKELYIPRTIRSKANFNVYVNTTDVNELHDGVAEEHRIMAGLLEERALTSGYYVIWENANRIHLVPAPTGKKQYKKATNGFGA